MDSMIRIYLNWNALEVGQFKPVKFTPETAAGSALRVAVDVPLDRKHIANLETVIQEQLCAGKEVQPVLTPKGMRYVVDQVQDALDSNEAYDADEWEIESDDPQTDLE